MAYSVDHPTLDFSSDHDPGVMGLKPCMGLHSGLGMEPLGALFLSLRPSPLLALSLSPLKKKKKTRVDIIESIL